MISAASQHFFDRDRFAVLGVRIQRCVLMTLDGDLRKVLAGGTATVHVASGARCIEIHEEGPVGCALVVVVTHSALHVIDLEQIDGCADRGQGQALVVVSQLLGADCQRNISVTARDRHTRHSEGGGTR